MHRNSFPLWLWLCLCLWVHHQWRPMFIGNKTLLREELLWCWLWYRRWCFHRCTLTGKMNITDTRRDGAPDLCCLRFSLGWLLPLKLLQYREGTDQSRKLPLSSLESEIHLGDLLPFYSCSCAFSHGNLPFNNSSGDEINENSALL